MSFLSLPRDIQETVFNNIDNYYTRKYVNTIMKDKEFELPNIDKIRDVLEKNLKLKSVEHDSEYIQIQLEINPYTKLIMKKSITDTNGYSRCICDVVRGGRGVSRHCIIMSRNNSLSSTISSTTN
jgi:hypothetical protein